MHYRVRVHGRMAGGPQALLASVVTDSGNIPVMGGRRLSDREDIQALQRAYAETFDARDADRFAGLFTEDAVVTAPWGQVIRGREKLRKAVVNTPPGQGWHKPGEADIKVSGAAASAIARFEALDANGDLCRGRYEDTYLRGPNGWRISSRTVIIEERVPLGQPVRR